MRRFPIFFVIFLLELASVTEAHSWVATRMRKRRVTASAPVFTESFEYGGSCPTGWTTVGSSNCSTPVGNANAGSRSLYLQAWIDYGSGTGIYKTFDLTGISKIEVDVTGASNWTYNKACLMIYSSAPTFTQSACSNGVLNAERTSNGKLTLNLSGQSGNYYVYLQAFDFYDIGGVYFDSLKFY